MVTKVASAPAPQYARLLRPGCGPLTVDDWYSLPDTPDQYELYDGVLLSAPPPDSAHQFTSGSLYAPLHSEAMDRQGAAMPAPTGVELSREIGFEPDVLYLTRERLDRVRRRGVRGAPNIAVEVLSPGTRKRDLDTKLPAYLAHGVEEVWIVDPEARTVTIHRPGEPPESVAYGERIPSRIVDVGTGGLDRLPPPLPDDDD